jgi:hypothetical protein
MRQSGGLGPEDLLHAGVGADLESATADAARKKKKTSPER